MAASLGRLVLTLTVALAGSLALTGPANAESVTARDARHDVSYVDFTVDEPVAEPAPQHANGDVTRLRVRHGLRRIKAVAVFRELNRQSPRLRANLELQWPGTHQLEYTDVHVRAGRGNWAGTATLTGDGDHRCEVATHVDLVANTLTVAFPRTCLGSPRWVRALVVVSTTDDVRDPTYVYYDQGPGRRRERFTPRVHAG
ncbi:hypothetical protein H5V45_02775 [Nocardioides sp. KIGAM211]|uniref:Uncharacterized protein n=1 Tax=Nocardioides luti TaxID=2761101 RepID=A0A7X0RDI4_9ACTN|nr:hypothetical protein [Nocardioides luti]MBB6626237.1 hypothetical protein [Nocardioides luti]